MKGVTMKKVKLAGTDVSALCLGTMFFGSKENEETSFALLDQYVEAGGSFLDTANNYASWVEGFSGGESETLLGHWLKDRNNRKEIFLATKVGARRVPVSASFPEGRQGLSAKVILENIEQSLGRLQTNYIDLYYAHIDDRNTPLEETLETFHGLVQSGKVRAIGCSNMATWRIATARQLALSNGLTPYSCVQQRHTLLRPNPNADFGVQLTVDNELLDYCRGQPDFKILAYSPLLSGAYTRSDRPLSRDYINPVTEAQLSELKTLAEELEATPNQVVLAWMLQSTPAIIPVISASKKAQLQENLEALNITLSSAQLERLNNAWRPFLRSKSSYTIKLNYLAWVQSNS
jgi:aryl-alcohol dehydrogenase-like predicted oxidoreductase